MKITTLPEKINSQKLTEELLAIGVKAAYKPERTATTLDSNGDEVYTSVAAGVEVYELPDGVTESDVTAIVAAHAPEESDAEVTTAAEVNRAEELYELLKLSTAFQSEIVAKLPK